MNGSFQYLRLYICPPPGMTNASQRARFGLGRQVLQSLGTLSLLSLSDCLLLSVNQLSPVRIALEDQPAGSIRL